MFSSNYESFIEGIRTLLTKDINWSSFIQNKVPLARYQLIKILTVIADFIIIVCFIISLTYGNRILHFTERLIKTLLYCINKDVQDIKKMTKWNTALFILILLFALIRSLWFASNMTIQYDEAWIYNYFIDNSFVQSFFLPSNNHKLYTSIAWWFNLLPIDKTFLIRLPNIIVGLIACILFFLFLKKHFSVSASLIAMAWFSSCLPIAIFMPTAKAYVFVLLFHTALLRIYYSFYKKYNVEKSIYWILTIVIILGYFSNPVFLFGHAFTTIFFLIFIIFQKNDYLKAKQIVYANLWAIPIILILYSADIISGAFFDLVDFAITQKINTPSFFLLCIDNNAAFQTGYNNTQILFIVIIVSGLILSINKKVKNKTLLLYAVSSIIWLPFYATLVKDDTSAYKTIYITASFTIILLFLYKYVLGKKISIAKTAWLSSILIIYLNLYLLQNSPWFNWSFKLNDSVQHVSKILLQNNAKSCYLSQFYYKPGLEFHFRTQNKPLKIFMGVPGSIDYVENIPDNPHPNFLIINKEIKNRHTLPFGYSEIYSDDFILVYKSSE